MMLSNGYDRRVNPQKNKFRYMTVGEAKRLRPGERVPFLANDGTQRDITINGEPKVWVRSPGVRVSLKYGMWEYTRIDSRHLEEHRAFPPLLVAL